MVEMDPNEQEIERLVEQLKTWIQEQPHLPKDLDDITVRRFLHSCYYDLEMSKKTVDLFFSIRASAPELVTNRDPLSPHIKKALSIINLAQLDISDKRFLWIWQLNDPGLEQYDYTMDAKAFFLGSDAWLLQKKTVWQSYDIIVLDVKDISLKFLTKFNISVAKKLSKYQQDAMPNRMKQIHLVNAPSAIDKIYGLMKPFLRQEITDMIHFHQPNSDTLYKYISKEDLPSDYGGSRPSMAELNKVVNELYLKHRETLIDENFWKSEKKGKVSKQTISSFKSLEID